MNLYDIVSPMTMAEAKTDYEKRRQRERDVDAGKPVSRQAKNPQTDYSKKRARDKKEMELGEAIGYESNKAYAEVGPYKRYTVYVTKKKFNEKFGFVAVAVNPRTKDAKFKSAGQTQQQAVANLQAEVDKEIDVATKVSGSATVDFNVDFVRDVLEMSSNTFYAKIISGPKLVIAGKEMEQYPDIMKQAGFKASSIRTVSDSEGATKLPAMPLSAGGAATAQLIANGRYALGAETIDKDGNRIFDLEFDSVVADPRERIRMGAPAITIGTKRDTKEDSWHAGDNAWSSDNHEMVEFAPSPEREDDEVPDQILQLANRWWNATDDQPRITNVLRSLGWSIAQVESEDDAVQMQHDDGTTYFISADDFDPDVFEGWFSSSPEEKAAKAEKQKQSVKKTLDSVLKEKLPELINDITYNQFEGSGMKWLAIRSGVFSLLPLLNDSIKSDLKKVSDSITNKLKAFGTNPELSAAKDDLFSLSLNPFKDSTKDYRLKFNQQMMMDKEFLLKQLNQYLLLLNKGSEQSVDEGGQDFNKVEPYAVCLAGKPVKKFDYYEQARRFHDNWKQKLYREGDKAKADTITLMPLNLDEAGSPAQQAAIAIAKKKEQGVEEAIVASGPSRPLDDRAVRKLVWDTMKINADTGEQAIERALSVLAKKPQSRMVLDLQDKFQSLADRLAQGLAEMDKSQKGAPGWNIDDYDYNKGKWHQGTIMTAKDAAEYARTELDNTFKAEPKPKAKKPVKESYWTKLQDQRNTKLNTLVNELKESVKK